MKNKQWGKLEFNCRTFFEDGRCPKERYNGRNCPFNVVPNGNQFCMYSGNSEDPQLMEKK